MYHTARCRLEPISDDTQLGCCAQSLAAANCCQCYLVSFTLIPPVQSIHSRQLDSMQKCSSACTFHREGGKHRALPMKAVATVRMSEFRHRHACAWSNNHFDETCMIMRYGACHPICKALADSQVNRTKKRPSEACIACAGFAGPLLIT
jgi:hypothetical protein